MFDGEKYKVESRMLHVELRKVQCSILGSTMLNCKVTTRKYKLESRIVKSAQISKVQCQIVNVEFWPRWYAIVNLCIIRIQLDFFFFFFFFFEIVTK